MRNVNAAALMKMPTITRAVGAVSPVRGAEPDFEVTIGALFGVAATVVVSVVELCVVVSSVSVAVVSVVSVVVLVRLSESAVCSAVTVVVVSVVVSDVVVLISVSCFSS